MIYNFDNFYCVLRIQSMTMDLGDKVANGYGDLKIVVISNLYQHLYNFF